MSITPSPNPPKGEAPKTCSTFLGGFSHKIIITSTTPIVTPEFSSDLERAPGARSIADENSGVTFGVVELRRCEAYEHFRSHPVLLGTLPHTRWWGKGGRPSLECLNVGKAANTLYQLTS